MKRKRDITPKQKAFADIALANPLVPITDIAEQVYETTTRGSAQTIASRVMNTPKVMAYMKKHAKNAEKNIIEIEDYSRKLGKTGSREGASYAKVALDANKEILDRVHGKAKQSVDVQSTAVTISVDLSGSV